MRGLGRMVSILEEEHDSAIEELRERKKELKNLKVTEHEYTDDEQAAWLSGYIQALEEVLGK